MPIVVIGNRSVLVCTNRQHPSHLALDKETTMVAIPGWYALYSVEPDNAAGAPTTIQRDGEHKVPIKAYACEACGHVELYGASIVDPNTWRGGK